MSPLYVCPALLLAATHALAQPATGGGAPGNVWPAKPLRIVSPFAPGGGNDTLSRVLATALTPRLGQQVVVENRPGANTIVGTELVVKSPPDGYTLIVLPNAITINPHLYRKMPFDVARDLSPVLQIGVSPLIFVVHPSLPARSVKDFLALARTKPNELTNGSSGNGSLGHLAGALLGICPQPGRLRGSRAPSSAFEEACPSRSSRAIFVSAYWRISSVAGSPATASRIRARSW